MEGCLGAPVVNPGTPGPPGEGIHIFDTASAASASQLDAFDTTGVADGEFAWVRSVEDMYVLNRSSALPADGINVVAGAVGGGQWLRKNLGSERWRSQAAWEVDPGTGNDENTGAPAAPLATWAEFVRRMGPGNVDAIPQTINVTLLADLPDTDPITGSFLFVETAALRITGTATTVASGTLDAGSTNVVPNSAPAKVVDAAIGDWTPFVGQRVRLTSGAASGAWAWLALILAPVTEARISPWANVTSAPFYDNATFALATASVGDDYVVETLSRCMLGDITVSSPRRNSATDIGALVLIDLTIGSTTGTLARAQIGATVAVGCRMDTQRVTGTSVLLANCRAEYCVVDDIAVLVRAGLQSTVGMLNETGAMVLIDMEHMAQGVTLTGQMNDGNRGTWQLDECSCFDAPLAGVFCNVNQAVRLIGIVWGSGNLVGIGTAGRVTYATAGVKPTITGTAGDTFIGSVFRAYADVPYVDATTLACVALTIV